ncbi:MAG TPA: DNA topoisomerase IV subunit A [Acidobacteriota bacterium]|nr:DNA topoisomerase IV subunit A [Acidobacteriota bacterium]
MSTKKKEATPAPKAPKESLTPILKIAKEVYESIKAEEAPQVSMPLRSLQNVHFRTDIGYFELLGKMKERQLSASTIKTFAQTLHMLNLAKELAITNDEATKREAYYISKNWGEAKFNEQPESDTVMDDIEAMLMINREVIGFVPEEKGGEIAGNLLVIDKDQETGETLRIDCTKFGSGAYSIPSKVEDLKFETKAKFILAIETAGMFQRLSKQNYWKKANCILISMGGVPTRATRRFIRRLADEMKLPVYVFTDGDPYGYLNIYRTLKVGSGNAAHINKYFCVPQATFLGVTPQDIIDYKLPTHALKDIDVKRTKDGMKNDPFIQKYDEWNKALNQMIAMKVRAEQQALAKWGLNFVIEKYLPDKIANTKKFLP